MECLEKAETVDDSDQMANVMTKIFFNITQVGGVVQASLILMYHTIRYQMKNVMDLSDQETRKLAREQVVWDVIRLHQT